MFRIVAVYNQPDDPEAFLAHYRSSHAVLTAKVPGVRSFTWGPATNLDGSPSEAFQIAEIDFDSREDAIRGLTQTPEGAAANADLEDLPHNGLSMYTYEF